MNRFGMGKVLSAATENNEDKNSKYEKTVLVT